jgi:predicted ribosomally synthesized peptide with SipW-like signal peptide
MKSALLAIMVIVGTASLAAAGTYAGFVDTETSKGNTFQAATVELYLQNPQGIGEQDGHGVKRTWHWENSSNNRLMEPGDFVDSSVRIRSFSDAPASYVDIECVNSDSELSADMTTENPAENTILGAGIGWDDDFDGLIDEDAIDDIDNDGDRLIDEDPPSGTVPLTPNRGIYDKDRVMIITYMKYHTTNIINLGINYINPAFFTPADDLNGDGRISLHEFSVKGLHGLTPVPLTVPGGIEFNMNIWFATNTVRHGGWVVVGDEYQGDQTDMAVIFTLR